MEDAQSKSKKIFKITKIPKIVDGVSIKPQISLNSTYIKNLHQHQLQIKDFNSLNESSQMTENPSSVNPNHIGVPFNIKMDNSMVKALNPIDMSKNTISVAPGQNQDNKQNYNYINIMTINVCPPVGGVSNVNNSAPINSNKSIMQPPMTNLNYNNNFNGNISKDSSQNAVQNQIRAQIISLIANGLLKYPNQNNTPSNPINKSLLNHIQQNLPNGIHLANMTQSQNTIQNNINSMNGLKPKLMNVGQTAQESSSAQPSLQNNSKFILNNIPNQTSNNFINSFNNINYLNNPVSQQVFANGKYDEIKNYFTKSANPIYPQPISQRSNPIEAYNQEKQKQKAKQSQNRVASVDKDKITQMRDFFLNQISQKQNNVIPQKQVVPTPHIQQVTR
jgi:hypothetical protein